MSDARERICEAVRGNTGVTTESYLDAFLAHPDDLIELLVERYDFTGIVDLLEGHRYQHIGPESMSETVAMVARSRRTRGES